MEVEAGLPENYDPNVVGEVGFPPGDTPEQFVANLMTYLKETATKLQERRRANIRRRPIYASARRFTKRSSSSRS